MTKQDIVREAIERFKHLPNRTIARYILYNYGEMFDNDLEKIRKQVLYWTASNGKANRDKIPEEKIIKREEPTKIPVTWRKTRTHYDLPQGRWLILSDIHIPFHEPKALDAAVQHGKQEKVTGVFFNGDLQDCAAISYWPSSMKRDFDREIELFIDFLDWIEQELPNTLKVYKPGNHEYRLPRLMQAKVPELIGLPLAALDTMLGLEERGIEFLDFYQLVLAGKLPILHGHEMRYLAKAVNPARGLFLKTHSYAMCGHCHSTSEHTERNISGTVLTTWSVGCLCDLSPDYEPYSSKWNHGFAIVDVRERGQFEVKNLRILPNGEVC